METSSLQEVPAERLKSELEKIRAKASHFLPSKAFVAGGALTSVFTMRDINDVDIYFRSREDFCRAVEDAYADNLWCVAATDRAVTFASGENIIQLMCFEFFADPAAIFDAFDFTACMAAYDVERGTFVFHEDFFKHNAQRYLKFHSGTRYPFGSLLRVPKYQSKGYSLGKGDLLRIALCCHGVQLDSWDALARAVGGQYGEKVSIDQTQPFSVAAAIEVIDRQDFTVPATPGEMPGSAEALLLQIGFAEVGRSD